MIKKSIFTLAGLLISIASHAGTEGPARVNVLDRLGVSTLTFEGAPAKALYEKLSSKIIVVSNDINEKVGENIACSEQTRMGNDPTLPKGMSSIGTHKVYRCGTLLINETGEAGPERVVEGGGGFSIGN